MKSSGKSLKQREIKKLDFDNKQMEWRLHQLKQVMENEKKERIQVGCIWKSAKNRSNLSRNISTDKSPKPKIGENKKITLLKDEPIKTPKKKSNYSILVDELQSENFPNSKKLTKTKLENKQVWISVAKDKNSEEVVDIQSNIDGNLPISSIYGINPNAIGLFFIKWGRKRILPAVDGNVIKPKTGWGTDIYYPYVAAQLQEKPSTLKTKVENNQSNIENKNQKKVEITEEVKSSISGGKLLQGSFDESESSKSFQEAVEEWRRGSTPIASRGRSTPDTREVSIDTVQQKPKEIEIKFSENTNISAADRLLLEKHRASTIPPLSKYFSKLSRKDDTDEDFVISEEDKEQRERLVQLFSPQKKSDFRSTTISVLQLDDDCDISAIKVQNKDFVIEEPNNEEKEEIELTSPMHNLRIEEINFTKKEEIKGSEATNQKMDLSSVSSLPIDPSAAYNYDMGNFFTGKSTKLIKPCEEVQPQFNLNNEIITGGKVNQKWIPSTSLFVADHNLKDGKSTNLDEKEVQQFQYKIESPESKIYFNQIV